MAKTANINIRIEPDIKAQAEAVYGSFGISVTDAINVFLRASIMDGGGTSDGRPNESKRRTL